MPIPSIVLGNGKMLATQTTDFSGIEIQTEGYLIGVIDDVYESADKVVVGDTFIFKESDAIQLKYGSTIYYYLDIENIQGIILPFAP